MQDSSTAIPSPEDQIDMDTPFQQARMALATVLEQLPYGCSLAQECKTLSDHLREHECLTDADIRS